MSNNQDPVTLPKETIPNSGEYSTPVDTSVESSSIGGSINNFQKPVTTTPRSLDQLRTFLKSASNLTASVSPEGSNTLIPQPDSTNLLNSLTKSQLVELAKRKP